MIGRKIGPISLLESKAKIDAAYGPGRPLRLKDGQIVTYYPSVAIGVSYYGGKTAGAVETTSPRYRTASGVGVGSDIEALRKIGAGCSKSSNICEGPIVRFGTVAHPAGSSTVFSLNHRGPRVVAIEMSLVS